MTEASRNDGGTSSAVATGIRDVLLAGGQVGGDLLAVDWSATPLGPPETWPTSLATAVRIMLGSRFSMWMAWGPELTFFCNDAYRRDTLGKKYPWALGRPASEVWAEIWSDISARVETVMRTGVATWDEALLLFPERNGYPEETYHTFSYSPLTDDSGHIAGLLCVVSEETERVIGERRIRTLRDLGSASSSIRSEDELFAVAREHLSADPRSLPFTVAYLFDTDAGTARLAFSTGIEPGHPAAPTVIDLDDRNGAWPADDLAGGVAVTVADLGSRFPGLPTGAWSEPPTHALVVPLRQQGRDRPYGFLVAGLNRHRPLDEGYRDFVDLIAGQLSSSIATARAYETERRRAEALAELDRAKTDFFTNVSHEFRTPLTLMLGPAEDALADPDQPLEPTQRRRVEVMHRNAMRLLKLVNTLLDFSRLESGRTEARFEAVDLSRYTRELAELFEPAMTRAGLSLSIDCPPMDEPVYVDGEMWAKIVLNLLSNALKYTFTGGVTVRLDRIDDVVELAVTDTGIGIEPHQQGRLFERFHRVAGVRSRSHEGSGIGLALVAELAGLHGGEVTVESEPGRGSTFRVRVGRGRAHLPEDQVSAAGTGAVPAAPDANRHGQGFVAEAMRWLGTGEPGPEAGAPAAGGVPRAAATGIAQHGEPHSRPRLLIVDDNADMRDYLITLLSGAYRVDTAADGAQALERMRTDPADLVLTDVMMPRLDGFGLLAALRADPDTALVPVIMLSARAGDESTVEGLDAGADDYLIKPFSARELSARIRANLELDRTRRARDELEHNRRLLDQAQRLAGVGSWEIDLATGAIAGSEEFLRQMGMTAAQLREAGSTGAIDARIHPDDLPRIHAALRAAVEGAPLDYEARMTDPDGTERIFHTIGVLERDADGNPARLHGSNQDITRQRQAERALAAAAAAQEAAAREHLIADELQRSLLPEPRFVPDHLTVATYYRPGVQGTQVGGDWFDVIELGADRTALVMGDVMGRGVRAAAVMGQLRAAVRAYARLDLPPADVLELLDGVVRDLGEYQIVTCLYAVYDPGERRLTYANAGHLPPLLYLPDGGVRKLTGAAGPPLGTGPVALAEQRLDLPVGSLLTLYTDGLVEHRDRDIDTGIDALARRLGRPGAVDVPLAELPQQLVDALLPDGPDDDVAVLLARVSDEASLTVTVRREIPAESSAVRDTRDFVAGTLRDWAVPGDLAHDIVLLANELVTNAVIHGHPPIELRLRHTASHLVLEVHDRATFLPRKMRPSPEDEHGRGLQLVAILADRWGARSTPYGKAVWCAFSGRRYGGPAAG